LCSESIAFLGPDSKYTALRTPVFLEPTGIPYSVVDGDNEDSAGSHNADTSSPHALPIGEEWTDLGVDAATGVTTAPSISSTSSGETSVSHPLLGSVDVWLPVKCRECGTMNYPSARKDWYAVIVGLEVGVYHR
jgi:hypothetical protein